MHKKLLWAVILLLTVTTTSAQEELHSYLTIPTELTKNANAVIRLSEYNVEVADISNMQIYEKRIVTVLNENGLRHIGAYVHYDNDIKVRDAEVIIYDRLGKKIEKIRKNDFQDVSAVSGSTMYSDSRYKYLDYTPTSYPFTAVFECTIETSNTANLPSFRPLDYHVGVQKSTYKLTYPENLTLLKKEVNLEEYDVIVNDERASISYTIKNIPGIKPEAYSPAESEIKPQAYLALNKFSYEGIPAEVSNWEEIGYWIYENLLKNRATIDAATEAKIKTLIADAETDREKAKRIYNYVQNKTRYISVQVGIGGYQPIPADEVDKVGYGDCKGLTNYTMALLKTAGIESYYTVVKSGSEIKGFYDDFASLAQGDHVILNIPDGEEDIWLECTNQKVPFGHIAGFTDNRNVLVVTPEGGKLKKTRKYTPDENFQETTGSYSLSEKGMITANVTVKTKGNQYRRFYIQDASAVDQDKYYKSYWKGVSNVNVDDIQHENDKENVVFTEKIKFKADAYSVLTGNRMLFAPNALNRYTNIPDRYRDRKFPLQIARGFYDVDEYEIKLPESFKVEAIPDAVSLESEFGNYSFSVTQKDPQTLVYKRSIKINDGTFPKEAYKEYRKFLKKIVKYDGSKVVLVKK